MDENLKKLYSEVPPTKLRDKEEHFRPARTSKFWLKIADFAFYGLLENRFYAFRYKGYENFLKRDEKYPTIFFAPHTNWWDGIVGYTICNRLCKKEIRLMIEELNRFPVIRRGGGFSVNKKNALTAMESLKYSVRVLQDLNSILYLFPQGIITPPDHRPIVFQTGLAYIVEKAAQKYGKVNLIPIAVNYFFMRDNRPEVWIEMGENMELTPQEDKMDRKEYSKFLAQKLEELCDRQKLDISNANFDGYDTLFQQKLVWYREFEQHLKKINIKRKKKETEE